MPGERGNEIAVPSRRNAARVALCDRGVGVNVGSLFSGIGGMDYGLHLAGHRHVFFCEKDEWRREVLAARWPGVPVYDDVRAVGIEPTARVAGDGRIAVAAGAGRLHADAVPDLLCGGFPCQDLSVAGQRRGLAGDRSGLFFEFARIIDAFRPGRLLIENVPGLFSSNGGRDFGTVVGTLADLGYGVAWRVLDSRYFGVPQRRRRVFIVGARADGDFAAAARRAGEILAVGSRCPGHPPTGTQEGQEPAVASLSGLGSGGPDDNDGQANRVIVSPALVKRYAKGTDSDATDAMVIADTVRTHPRPGSNSNGNIVVAAPLTKGSASGEGVNAPGRRQEDDVNIVPYTFDWQMGGSWSGDGKPSRSWIQDTPGRTRSLVKNKTLAVHQTSGVRRLTPTECERLQGLPDGWTRLDAKTPDSRRYSALGDAVTAPVAAWIGARL